jgi:hypothetical protein
MIRLCLWNALIVDKKHLEKIGEFKTFVEIEFPFELEV